MPAVVSDTSVLHYLAAVTRFARRTPAAGEASAKEALDLAFEITRLIQAGASRF
jgi:hypothetical protein